MRRQQISRDMRRFFHARFIVKFTITSMRGYFFITSSNL
jgi:hypothetical protein